MSAILPSALVLLASQDGWHATKHRPGVVTAIQALTEAVRPLRERVAGRERREKVEKALQRAQAARAAIMAEGMQ